MKRGHKKDNEHIHQLPSITYPLNPFLPLIIPFPTSQEITNLLSVTID